MKKELLLIAFWGGIWGICEASFGFVLHLAAVALPGIPGTLMFPIGFFCMHRARAATGRAAAPLSIAAVAAAIKLADFFLPGYDAIRVVNPALSILMEGFAVSLVYALFAAPGCVADYARLLGMGVLWRAVFAAYLFAISLFGLPAGLVTSGAATLLRFVLLESVYNSLIMYGGLWLARKLPAREAWKIGPVAASAAILLAVGLQVLL